MLETSDRRLNSGQLAEVRKLLEREAAHIGSCDFPKNESSPKFTAIYVAYHALQLLDHTDAVEEENDRLHSEIAWVSDSMATDWEDQLVGMPENYPD